MSIIEKDLAEAHVYWSKQKAAGESTVPIDRHLNLIMALLKYEQADRERVSAASIVAEAAQ